jgi:hypothetical protein
MSVISVYILNVCEGLGIVRYSNITLSENFSFYLIQTKRIIILIMIIIHMQACVEIVRSEAEYWRPALGCSTLVVGLLGDIQARQLVMFCSLVVVSRHELVILRPVMCPSPIHQMIFVYEWIGTWSVGGNTAVLREESVHHKLHMYWMGKEPWPLRWTAATMLFLLGSYRGMAIHSWVCVISVAAVGRYVS